MDPSEFFKKSKTKKLFEQISPVLVGHGHHESVGQGKRFLIFQLLNRLKRRVEDRIVDDNLVGHELPHERLDQCPPTRYGKFSEVPNALRLQWANAMGHWWDSHPLTWLDLN